MPFISKDWRGSGDLWVKTNEGWEKLKVLECEKKNPDEEGQGSEDKAEIPPHCQIVLRCTREIAGFNGLGEVVKRLDFRSSVKNHRRFHYICALLKLLVSGEAVITQLSGGAQRILLQMVEEVALHVSDSQQNINVLKGLVDQLNQLVDQENQKCWGKPLGSQNLWINHLQTIERIQNIASQIEIKGPTASNCPQLNELPEECIRKIILHLSDHKDLESSAAAYSLMEFIIQEQRIWRELSFFHFTQTEIDYILDKMSLQETEERHRNWQTIYHALRKKFGLRDDFRYTEVLALCRLCRCLFWPSMGHPCIIDQSPEYRERLEKSGGTQELQLVKPQEFLKYFSL